ncbi:hypothetical protein KI387_044603, partial [Taxus chinensis]
MGNWPASTSVGKRAESRYVGCWVADGEYSLRGKGISTGSMMDGGDDESSSISGGIDRCSSVGGGGNGCSSIGGGGNGCSYMGGGGNGSSSTSGGGTVGKGSLSGEARGERGSMLVEDSSVGNEGDEMCSSVGEGIVE